MQKCYTMSSFNILLKSSEVPKRLLGCALLEHAFDILLKSSRQNGHASRYQWLTFNILLKSSWIRLRPRTRREVRFQYSIEIIFFLILDVSGSMFVSIPFNILLKSSKHRVAFHACLTAIELSIFYWNHLFSSPAKASEPNVFQYSIEIIPSHYWDAQSPRARDFQYSIEIIQYKPHCGRLWEPQTLSIFYWNHLLSQQRHRDQSTNHVSFNILLKSSSIVLERLVGLDCGYAAFNILLKSSVRFNEYREEDFNAYIFQYSIEIITRCPKRHPRGRQ